MLPDLWPWLAFTAGILLLLALDLGVFHRRPHEVGVREAALWSGVWVALALLFALGLHVVSGPRPALEFLTGWLVEKSLSVDNIFVIVTIFSYFAVPARLQHRVLFWGILGALVMRGAFIVAGAYLLDAAHWVVYIFGALLVLTGIKLAVREERPFDGDRNPVLRLARRLLPVGTAYDGPRFITRENGRRVVTPLLLVLLSVEFTDLIFAVDSIPAVFAVTRDPFLVFTSNVFAVLGLRSLYFLLARAVTRIHLLRYGLAAILVFVGVKMTIAPWWAIPVGASLGVIAIILGATVIASLWLRPRGGGARADVVQKDSAR